ncbi:MAG: nucleoside transporter C-terminal domain-containing protein [Hyphomicrobiaceae bacterium]|nr:nucleoside transporter C-terminal domain-containing protein [Hyphomicrobiaceae bacterium]
MTLLQAQSAIGLVIIPLIAYALSESRRNLGAAALARTLLAGLALQLVVAAAMLNVPAFRAAFDWAGGLVASLQRATGTGMRLVFGYLAGGTVPFDTVRPEAGFILAFQALPVILVISALSKLLYHWGLLQPVVRAIGRLLQRTLGVTGPVATSAAANILVGMVEAPLLVRPYLLRMSRGELFATMTAGMAGVAGTVLALYATILEPVVPGAAGHLIVASVISIPAALMLSALMVPDDKAAGGVAAAEAEVVIETPSSSSMDAIAQGTREGVELLVSVAAMLVVAVALVALANQLLGFVAEPFGVSLTFERMLGWLFAPLAFVVGIPLAECATAGSLLGVKTVLNELVAYLQMTATPAELLSPRSRLILAYALCGFANLGSLGILVGGMVAMVPQRRAEIVSLGAKTVVSGTLATLLTAAVVGVLTP